MNKIIRGFRQAVEPKHPYQAGHQLFLNIDLPRIKRNLNLELNGKEDGSADYPSSDSAQLSKTELAIRAKFDELVNNDVTKAQDGMSGYQKSMSTLGRLTDAEKLKAMKSSACTDLDTEASIEVDNLKHLREDLVERKGDFERFKIDEGIIRAPKIRPNMTWAFAQMLFVVFLELAGNAFFFQVGNELGYLGAIMEAIIVPVLNVGITYILVFFGVRRLWSRALWKKVVGWLSLLLWIVFIVVLNMGVAKYRDELGGLNPANASVAAVKSLLTNPILLEGIHSWALFGLGIFVSAVAFYEVWKIDDPVPGYGSLGRAHADATTKYRDQRSRALDNMAEVARNHRDEMESARRNIDMSVSNTEQITANVTKLNAQLKNQLTHLNNCAQECAAEYREANIMARKSPSPENFSNLLWEAQSVSFDALETPSFLREENKNEIQELKGLLTESLEELNRTHRGAIEKVKSLDQIEEMEAVDVK